SSCRYAESDGWRPEIVLGPTARVPICGSPSSRLASAFPVPSLLAARLVYPPTKVNVPSVLGTSVRSYSIQRKAAPVLNACPLRCHDTLSYIWNVRFRTCTTPPPFVPVKAPAPPIDG